MMDSRVTAGFNRFHTYLTPGQSERDATSRHRESVESALKTRFGVLHYRETGSFGAGTGITRHADLDLIASIPDYHSYSSSSGLLEAIKAALQQSFPSTLITIRTPAVVVNFNGGLEKVEVVPGYFIDTIDGSNYYKIPDFGGSYQISSPRTHIAYVQQAHNRLNSDLKPLIRFIKAIKYYNDIDISSFYLEMRVAKWSENENAILFPLDVYAFTKYLVNTGLADMRDPTAVAGMIKPTSTDVKREAALSKFNTALTRSRNAYDYTYNGNIDHAFTEWNKLFDDKFGRP